MKNRISSSRSVEGFAFSDNIRLERSSRHHYDTSDSDSAMRGFLFLIILGFFAILLIAKLFFVQIAKGSYYRNLSDSNRIRTTVIHAPRGIIFDRNKTPLVFNIPGFRVVENSSSKNSGQIKTKLLSRDQAMPLLAANSKNIEVDSLREYPYKEITSHVVGYIGQITKDQLENPLFAHYNLDDLLGKMGIEQEYETKLKGVDGKQLVEVDATGKAIRTLGQEEPIPGNDITLTLDINLQKAAFLAMKDVKKGAVIVSNPKGEILALVSKPSFDPNIFTQGQSYKIASDSAYKNISEILLDNEGQPLINRAIGEVYPPGSTFKLVTAVAGLEDKIIDDRFTIIDNGTIRIGEFSFGNWYFLQYGKTDGEINVTGAIKRSNDIFFYKLAQMIGVDKLSNFASQFGLGKKLGIDLIGEQPGLVPTQEWKQKTIGEPWYLGDTYHYGIGQGYLLTTPLQVNAWTQVIANGGVLYEPHLLKNQKSKIKNQNLLTGKIHDLIQQGMIESCSTGGVAWPLFEFKVKNAKLKIDGKNFLEAPQSTVSASFKDYRKVSVACKTGTAQHGTEETLPHAWITLFAPAYNPQIVVTVLAESSGEGSSIAGPIAKKILEEWFSR